MLLLWFAAAGWHMTKPLPAGMHVRSEWAAVPAGDVRFLRDQTTADAYGRALVDQQIFDHVLAIVGAAREFIVLDFFLFNDHAGAATPPPYRELSAQLRDALIARKRAVPRLQVLFITDPINDVYGGAPSADLDALRTAGIDVVVTNLDRLRDSNPVYSGLWRLAFKWWSDGESAAGWLPNPLDDAPERVGPEAWARLMNFKANHRKVILADDGAGRITGLVTSANPHDASSAHSNVALVAAGPALHALLASELDVARFSGWAGSLRRRPAIADDVRDLSGSVRVQALTEGAIFDALAEELARCRAGHQIDIAMFYLADRRVLEALRAAAKRGAAVRLILDPNKDAFGRAKTGIPNRPVASELVTGSDGAIRIRWYLTRGEQFHTKLVAISGQGRFWMTLGSANLTRRNIDDYNLEANLAIEAEQDARIAQEVRDWFDALWRNRAPAGVEYTADFSVYADASQAKYWAYRLMEATGLSTF